MWHVYELYDPRNNKPFYVGKGVGRRLYNTKGINEGNSLKRKFIAEIRKQGLKVKLLIVASYENELDALDHEKKLIQSYGRIIAGDGILANYSIGGDTSNTGWIPSDKTRELWSKQRKNKKQSKEHITARIDAIRGRKNTKEQNLNCSKARIKQNAELKLKIIKKLEEEPYYHGAFRNIARELNCNHELVRKIYNNLNLYKETLNERI